MGKAQLCYESGVGYRFAEPVTPSPSLGEPTDGMCCRNWDHSKHLPPD